MDKKAILARVDHTELNPAATWEDIRRLCDEGVRFGVASVCIPPCYVKRAAVYLDGKLPVCTVIGFPHGNSPTAAKAYEAAPVVAAGAAEVDMVVNCADIPGAETISVMATKSGGKVIFANFISN